MTDRYLIGWVRDAKGRIVSRPRKEVCNAITSFTGGGKYEAYDGLAPTAPHIGMQYE